MKYIEKYLETVIKVKPLGKLTTKEDELNGMSGEMVYIDGKCSDIFISYADYANWLERQGKQKPVEWNKEDEKYIFNIAYFLEHPTLLGECNKHIAIEMINWIKSIKNRMQPQEWSKEDEVNLNEAPEMIWITPNFQRRWFTKEIDDESTEYVRKDAFIKKVINFLNYKLDEVVAIRVPGTIRPHHVAKQELIEDLNKYMKGE